MIPKNAPNLELTKRFAAHLFEPDGYIRQLHAAPGHVLPVLKTISALEAYQANEIIQKYSADVDRMAAAAAAGHNLGWESPAHKPNTKAGQIVASHVFAEAVQALRAERRRHRCGRVRHGDAPRGADEGLTARSPRLNPSAARLRAANPRGRPASPPIRDET